MDPNNQPRTPAQPTGYPYTSTPPTPGPATPDQTPVTSETAPAFNSASSFAQPAPGAPYSTLPPVPTNSRLEPQPAYPQPAPTDYKVLQKNPGKKLAIVSLIMSIIFLSIPGVVFGIIAKKKSRNVGMKNTIGTVAVVVGLVTFVIGLGGLVALEYQYMHEPRNLNTKAITEPTN